MLIIWVILAPSVFWSSRGAHGLSESNETIPKFLSPGSGLSWVAALPREGHTEACARQRLDPTKSIVNLRGKVRINFTENAAVVEVRDA